MAKKELSIKKRDTFFVTCTYKEEGVAVDITTIDIRSEVRNAKNELIHDLTVTKLNQSVPATLGKYTLRADTFLWPEQSLFWDIVYTKDGIVQSSETLTINVIHGITSE